MKDLMQKIGKAATYHVDALRVFVKIIDVRQSYGRIDYCITPESGDGIKWVNSTSVSEIENGDR